MDFRYCGHVKFPSSVVESAGITVDSMEDNSEPLLPKVGLSTYKHPFHKLKRVHWWMLVVLNIFLVIFGQAAGVLMGRFYYDRGGSSKWMATLIQTAGFPILLIPYFLIGFSYESPGISSAPFFIMLCIMYVILGALIAGDNMMYSFALMNLSASTYSLICATQLAFNAIFSFFINGQKFTSMIMNSVVVLSLSAALLAVDDDHESSGVSKSQYFVGVVNALVASAMYSLLLSLMQLIFERVLKKETFTVVLEMQICTATVATCVTIVGLLASGEWRTIRGEMDSFGAGKVSYVMTLVSIAVAWQVCSVGMIGLIFTVSSLFSNVISTLSLAVTPIASLVIFRDEMNSVKIIVMLMAFWGFASYIYQNHLDNLEARKDQLRSIDDDVTRDPCD